MKVKVGNSRNNNKLRIRIKVRGGRVKITGVNGRGEHTPLEDVLRIVGGKADGEGAEY